MKTIVARSIRYGSLLLLLAGLLLWPARASHGQEATLRCRLEPERVELQELATLILEVDAIQDLYGYELALSYDSALVQFQDADPDEDGVNLALGNFLSNDFVALNQVDQESNEVRIAVTQLNPSPPQSGSGELAMGMVLGIAEGVATFDYVPDEVILSDMDGGSLPVTLESCFLTVGAEGQPTPTQTPTTEPTATPTITPTGTATATGTIENGTAQATDTPTPTPTHTLTPVQPTSTPTPSSPTPTPEPGDTATPTSTPTLTPTPTHTVVIITTPTPRPDQLQQNGEGQAEPPAQQATPTDTPTGTPADSPLPTPIEDTPTPTETPAVTEPAPDADDVDDNVVEDSVTEDDVTPPATPTPTPTSFEQLSPPRLDGGASAGAEAPAAGENVAAGESDASESATSENESEITGSDRPDVPSNVVDSEPDAGRTDRQATTAQRPSLDADTIVLRQPDPTQTSGRGDSPGPLTYTIPYVYAWALLLGAVVSAAIAWRAGRRQ